MRLRIKQIALVCALAAFAAAPAFAQAPAAARPAAEQTKAAQDRSTTIEFTTVTRLPGITLQPGKYVFRLGRPEMKQNVVEVYSSDGTKKIATLLTVDYATPARAGVSTVAFDRTNPPALRAWYVPGVAVGREFVWSEDEARTLHTAANTPVLWATWN